ncbi:MAG: tyrosine-protein phosphatase [Propionibacteriaceae bacterium]|jgi:protein-tyrosine phosphatase|nr:tyrosine-protein phosphatase [Propionibacteriaceae bacterium]
MVIGKRFGAAAITAALLVGCSDLPQVPSGVPALPLSPSTPAVISAEPQTPSPTPSPSVVPSTPSAEPTPSGPAPALGVYSISNFRDLAGGGKGLALAGGARMAQGVVYRSAKLDTASKADLATLAEAGIGNVYDLRTSDAAKDAPDPKIGKAKNTLINLYASNILKAPTSSVKAAREHAKAQQRLFVTDFGRRKALAKMLKSFASASGPVIIHCTSGKDRTGWAAAVLQLAAGASEKDVIKQYLLSNEYRAQEIEQQYAADKAKHGASYADVERAYAEVDKSYIQASLDEMQLRYGGIDGYLVDALGLPESTIAKIKAKLTAK